MKKEKLMKIRQILALVGVGIIFLLYLATLVCAFIDRSQSKSMLLASIFATFFVAFVVYAFNMAIKIVKPDDNEK